MGAVLDRLREVLASRYRLVREIGRGGMAAVYLAEDLKHHRPVAIKVLNPELSATIGTDRFLREIEIVAGFNHPHILPLHDSGQAEGLLYYVMPYVEGESLRDRLDREKRLPVADALRIAVEAADGLAYAHTRGVIHRDIKPDNILLSAEHAVIADFGIARAVRAASEGQVTATGLLVGSPVYMSPEQLAGEEELDGRSDIYSLACTLYEMLVGRPPFSGRTLQALLTERVVGELPPIRAERADVSGRIERIVHKALAATPADRYPTAGDFLQVLGAARPGAVSTSSRSKRRTLLASAAVVASIGLLAVAVWRLPIGSGQGNGGRVARTDTDVVAVLPFGVAAADPGLEYLREGMVDLLSARLIGDGGPRAVDPRALLSVWHRAGGSATEDLPEESAVKLAGDLGAGRMVTGGIVGTPAGLVLTASSTAVPDGRVIAAARAEGPADSLTHLVDQLVAQLLALEAGESEHRLAALTSTSLPAMRAYLDGQAAYRRGRYEDAMVSFQNALAIDSTFALAAIGLRNAASWTAFARDAVPVGLALAWASRDRLSSGDRAFLRALVGPRYPSPSPIAAQLAAWEQAVRQLPDRAEAWYELGEVIFHWGPLIDVDSRLERSESAFARSLALDSTFHPPLEHLYDIASVRRDTSQIRSLGEEYLASGAGGRPELIRWQMALALGDREGVQTARQELVTASPDVLALVVFFSQITSAWGGGLDDADVAIAELLRRSTTESERWITLGSQRNLALNRGRPQVAAAIVEEMGRIRPEDRSHLGAKILDALYWNGDSLAAVDAARELARLAEVREAPTPPEAGSLDNLCALEQWRLWHGNTRSANASIAMVDAAAPADPGGHTTASICALQLRALLAHVGGRPDAEQWAGRLDAALRVGPVVNGLGPANLTLLEIRKARGDLTGALAVSGRHPLMPGGETYLATFLRKEGRLAAATGDTLRAIRALVHYLALRSEPEPVLAGEVEEIAELLAGLAGFERDP